MAKRTNFEIFLRALKNGCKLQLGNFEFIMIENSICYSNVVREDEQGNKYYQSSDIDINWFIKKSEELSESQIMIIGANSAMKEMANERIAEREESFRKRKQIFNP